jgi:NAD-dependent deacetylase
VRPALRVGPSDRVFVLTGAGISAESGIRTFRDARGLWEKYRFEEVASPEGWAAHPQVAFCRMSCCMRPRSLDIRGHE